MLEGREKTQGRGKGPEEDGVDVRDAKENASEQESVKDILATEKRHWELRRLLNNGKGSLSSTSARHVLQDVDVDQHALYDGTSESKV